jgi:hypothetical protein
MIYPNYVEPLERRQLLAGVTLIFPAFDGGLTGWVDTTANAITSELGGAQNVPNYTLTIAPDNSGALVVTGVTHVAGSATPQANNPGQIVVIVDYTSVSANPGYPASATADVVANFMETTPVDGVMWAELPIHLISQSIGTITEDATAAALDDSGIWVDQETYLDAHPDEDSPFFDPPNTVYDNVEFADDYWRTGGANVDQDDNPNGNPVDGAYNLELTWVQSDYGGYAIAHLAPPGYYIGTIDQSFIGESDGDGPIHSEWYGNGSTPTTLPSATQTGFLYSNIDGGTRPVSGLWAASGGTGVRTAVTHTGLQWPNVSDVVPSTTTAASDGTLDISFIHEDQGETDNIVFTLDSDQNPFNGSSYTLGTASNLASSTSIKNGTFTASLAGVAPGTYWVEAEAEDSSGLMRYNYSIEKVTITAPAITITDAAHSNPATVTGTGTHLAVYATDADNGSALTYTWAFTHLPSGAAKPAISHNGTNDALVTFYKQGGYYFTVTVSDGKGHTDTSSGFVDVVQTATKMVVSPEGATVAKLHARRFSTTVIDQFNRVISDPATEYSIVSGPATIGFLNGIFNAGDSSGTALIKVEDDGLSDIVDVHVVN